jgi:hypothetical protein
MRYLVVLGPKRPRALPARLGPLSLDYASPADLAGFSADAYQGSVLAVPAPAADLPRPLYALTPTVALTHPEATPLFSEAADPALVLATLLALLDQAVPRPESAARLAARLRLEVPAVALLGPHLGRLAESLRRGRVRLVPPEEGSAPLVLNLPWRAVSPRIPLLRPLVSVFPLALDDPPPAGTKGARVLYGDEEQPLLKAQAGFILVPDHPDRLREGLRRLKALVGEGRTPRAGRLPAGGMSAAGSGGSADGSQGAHGG